MIRLKRAYEEYAPADGYRILVDRLWPRGLSKERAAIDLWLKDIAPSGGLRKWFGHDPKKWAGFKKRYLQELAARKELLEIIREKSKKGKVTLVFGAADLEHNNAVVLKEHLKRAG